MLNVVTYTMPSSAPSYIRGKEVKVTMPFVPMLGNNPIRKLIDPQTRAVTFDAYCLVPDVLRGYMACRYDNYEQIKDGDYAAKVRTSYIGDYTWKGDANYYDHCSARDYLSKCLTGQPERTLKETWPNHPMPIAFNTVGADRVVVSREGKELTFSVADSNKVTLISNFVPGKKYTVQVMAGDKVLSTEIFIPTGDIRLINLENIHNVRDIGLKPCYDDAGNLIGHLDCCRIYRGYSLADANANTMETLINVMGVDVVLDLSLENNETLSGVDNLLGTTHGWGTKDIYIKAVTDSSVMAIIKKDLEIVADRLSKGKNFYIHCEGGMDRTGTFCFLIEALCGCTLNDVIHDYEISSMTYSGGLDDSGISCRIDASNKLLYVIKYLHDHYGTNGETLRQQVVAWLTKAVGVSQSAIEQIRTSLVVS